LPCPDLRYYFTYARGMISDVTMRMPVNLAIMTMYMFMNKIDPEKQFRVSNNIKGRPSASTL